MYKIFNLKPVKRALFRYILPGGACLFLAAILIYQRERIMPAYLAARPCYLALIIDDFGNNQDGTDEFLQLDIPFTAAVMPGMPYTDAECAKLTEKGVDIILHMPMEPHNGSKSWLGANALTTDLSDADIYKNVSDSLLQVSDAIGVNNHMGSKAMESERVLDILFQCIKKNELVFIDSMTTRKSKAASMGEKHGVTVLSRDVFLDGTKNTAQIEKNLLKAGNTAKKNGYAIAIGHVGQEGGKPTAAAIAAKAEEMRNDGIIFVSVSELLRMLEYSEGL